MPEDVQEQYNVTCEECCSCRRQILPYFFDTWNSETGIVSGNNIPQYPYLDNKHKPLQLTLSALADTFVVFTVELLNGQYLGDFVRDFTDIGSMSYVHRCPFRSSLSLPASF